MSVLEIKDLHLEVKDME